MNNQSLYLLTLLTLLSFSCLAQTDQGTWLVGISGNGSFKSTEQSKVINLQIAPQIGYFIRKNMAIGGQLTSDHLKNTFMGNINYKSRRTSLQAMTRYYIGDWKARPYLNFMAGYTWNRVLTVDMIGQTIQFRGDESWNASLGAGLAYFVAPNVALEAEANYRHHFSSDLGRRNNNAVTLRLGLSLYLR